VIWPSFQTRLERELPFRHNPEGCKRATCSGVPVFGRDLNLITAP
jgi:hypothetical protein